MFLYAIVASVVNHPQDQEAGLVDFVKIGVTTDPVKRISQLKTGCPFELYIEAVIRCQSESWSYAYESHAHRILEGSRQRGEWFKMDDVVKRFLEFDIHLYGEEVTSEYKAN